MTAWLSSIWLLAWIFPVSVAIVKNTLRVFQVRTRDGKTSVATCHCHSPHRATPILMVRTWDPYRERWVYMYCFSSTRLLGQKILVSVTRWQFFYHELPYLDYGPATERRVSILLHIVRRYINLWYLLHSFTICLQEVCLSLKVGQGL